MPYGFGSYCGLIELPPVVNPSLLAWVMNVPSWKKAQVNRKKMNDHYDVFRKQQKALKRYETKGRPKNRIKMEKR